LSETIVRVLTEDDWSAYRALRLAGLQESSDAFVRSYTEEAAYSEECWRSRMRRASRLLAERDGVPRGIVSCAVADEDPASADVYARAIAFAINFYRAAWLGVTFMVSGLGVAVALLSDHAKVNCAVSAAVGIAVGAITCAAQEAQRVSDYRRQALTAAAIGTAGCCAIAGLTTLFGHQALLVLVWLAVTPPPAVRIVIATAHRLATHRWP
jgi:hypothetical protein